MLYLRLTLLIILFVSCDGEKVNCVIKMDDLLKSNKVFMPGSDSYQVIDKGKDSIIGGAYFFHHNKKLQSYKFFGSKSAYTYSEEYDEKGNLIRTEGEPIVYQNIKEINRDSLFITYYLFAYNRSYFQPKISMNNKSKVDLELKNDSLYSNMLSGSMGFNIAGISSVNLYLEIKCINHCTEQVDFLIDTMTLSKYPKLDVINK